MFFFFLVFLCVLVWGREKERGKEKPAAQTYNALDVLAR